MRAVKSINRCRLEIRPCVRMLRICPSFFTYVEKIWDRVHYVMCIEDPYEENMNLARRIHNEKGGESRRCVCEKVPRILHM